MARPDPSDDLRTPPDRLLAWPRVKDLTGLSRTTAWRLQKAGDFPPPVRVSPGRVSWRESDIVAWSGALTPRSCVPPSRSPGRPRAGAAEALPTEDAAAPRVRPSRKPAPRAREPGSQQSFEF